MTALVATILAFAVASAAPGAPTVRGPRSVSPGAHAYVFAATEPGVAAARLRYRCALDAAPLHPCPRRVVLRLTAGTHVLRVQAVDPAGRAGPIRRATIVVRGAAPSPPASLLLPGPLAAGSYRSSTNCDPEFTVTVPAGWGAARAKDACWLYEGTDPNARVIAISRCEPEQSVDDTVARIAATPGLFVVQPAVDVRLRAGSGKRLDVVATAADVVYCSRGGLRAYFDEGDRAQIYLISVGGATRVLSVSARGSDLDAFLADAMRVLQTIRFE